MDGLTAQDYEILEMRFKNMANEGLLIEKMQYRLSYYKRIQPKDIDFAIGIYPKAKRFEKPDEKVVGPYIKEQEDKGWKLVFSKDYTHVFMNEDKKSIEDIDRTDQIENIKSILKPEMIGLFFTILLNTLGLFTNWGIEVYHFSSNIAFLSLLFMPVIIGGAGFYLIYDIFRYIRILNINNPLEIQMESISGIVFLRKIWSLFIIVFIGLLAGGIIIDSLVSGSRILLYLIPLVLIIFIVYKLRAFFPELKLNTTTKTIIGLVGVFILALIVSSGGLFSIDDGFGNELPKDYIALNFEDVGIKNQPNDFMFRKEGSFLIPLQYNYTEYSDFGEYSSLHVSTQVKKALNEKIAEYIFNLQVKNSMKYYSKTESANDYYTGYDNAVFSINQVNFKEEVVLQDGQYVFIFYGDFDLKDQKIIELIKSTTDKIIIKLD